MSVRLDWEIASEKQRVRARGEDLDASRRRRVLLIRLLITVGLILGALSGILFVVMWRLEQYDDTLEQSLRDTVAAEITALRLGDLNAFAGFQRSATDDWLRQQRTSFQAYQELLQSDALVQLTGQVVDLQIDDPRARVHVEEIIDGVPYTRVWFYWRYEDDFDDDDQPDGWRHVPQDPTFWGDSANYSGSYVEVAYNAVDAPLATQMGDTVDSWLALACGVLSCANLPTVEVAIESEGVDQVSWAADNPWRLRVPSPYKDRARADLPFDGPLRQTTATLLAQRLVQFASNNVSVIYPADSYYLRDAAVSWLVGRFLQIDNGSYLIESLVAQYGQESLGILLQNLTPEASISLLSGVTGATLDQSGLDWRDFFSWRLALEGELILRQDSERFLALYVTDDEAVRADAYARFSDGRSPAGTDVVTVQAHMAGPDGAAQMAAVVQGKANPEDMELYIFRLVNNTWLRAS